MRQPNTPLISKDEFERAYAERGGMTVDELHSDGSQAYPCSCYWDECEGWQMLDAYELARLRKLGMPL